VCLSRRCLSGFPILKGRESPDEKGDHQRALQRKNMRSSENQRLSIKMMTEQMLDDVQYRTLRFYILQNKNKRYVRNSFHFLTLEQKE